MSTVHAILLPYPHVRFEPALTTKEVAASPTKLRRTKICPVLESIWKRSTEEVAEKK